MLSRQTTNRQNRSRSSRHENDVAKELTKIYGEIVTLQPGSGNQPGAPNDVRVAQHTYVECKETSAMSMTLKHSWLERLRSLSVQGAMQSLLAIRFSNGPPWARDYYLVDADRMYHLLECERAIDSQKP